MKTLPMKNASFSDEIRHLLYWKTERIKYQEFRRRLG